MTTSRVDRDSPYDRAASSVTVPVYILRIVRVPHRTTSVLPTSYETRACGSVEQLLPYAGVHTGFDFPASLCWPLASTAPARLVPVFIVASRAPLFLSLCLPGTHPVLPLLSFFWLFFSHFSLRRPSVAYTRSSRIVRGFFPLPPKTWTSREWVDSNDVLREDETRRKEETDPPSLTMTCLQERCLAVVRRRRTMLSTTVVLG